MAEVASLSKLIEVASCGNKSAQHFLQSIYHAIGIWDDLIDKDSPPQDIDIHTVFEFFLVHLPRNLWYRQNMDGLAPVMEAFIINWHSGNSQKASHPEQTYILRQMYFDLITAVAKINGGWIHAKTVNLQLWKETGLFMSLEEYKLKDTK